RLRKLKERRDPIMLPEHAHIEMVAAAAPPMLAALTRTALATGCRQDELVQALRCNFSHSARQLTVRGKGNKIRTIELDQGTTDMLNALPIALGCQHLFWHRDGEPFRGIAST